MLAANVFRNDRFSNVVALVGATYAGLTVAPGLSVTADVSTITDVLLSASKNDA